MIVLNNNDLNRNDITIHGRWIVNSIGNITLQNKISDAVGNIHVIPGCDASGVLFHRAVNEFTTITTSY